MAPVEVYDYRDGRSLTVDAGKSRRFGNIGENDTVVIVEAHESGGVLTVKRGGGKLTERVPVSPGVNLNVGAWSFWGK